MEISTQLLNEVVFYETEYFDGENWYPVCNFGKVSNVNISVSGKDNSPEYITIEDNKKRTTNFCAIEKQKTNNYIAQDISILKMTSGQAKAV